MSGNACPQELPDLPLNSVIYGCGDPLECRSPILLQFLLSEWADRDCGRQPFGGDAICCVVAQIENRARPLQDRSVVEGMQMTLLEIMTSCPARACIA